MHLLLDVLQHVAAAAFEEEQRLVDDLAVLLGRAVSGARGDAALDVVVEAGAGVGAGDRLGAGAPGEELLHHVERAPHRARRGVWPEVARAVLLDAAGDGDARPVLLHVDLEVGVVLVVLEADVVDGLVALDEGGLQQQRLRLVAGDDVVKCVDLLDERVDAALHAAAGAEVGAHAGAQPAGLADVEHLPAGVLHQVDARTLRKRLRLLEDSGLGHAIQCSAARDGAGGVRGWRLALSRPAKSCPPCRGCRWSNLPQDVGTPPR